ncbi:DUF4331 family protein [uncultured Phenylobacterium sp.]|uniref:DUF4331 family protein n=1 Tax=uncultured Phenylobacterium sp. TaxID=349273 RepID=UPI0025DE2105|nr:DUF4331 family protein [uncultured Phenylobacterium sp.]
MIRKLLLASVLFPLALTGGAAIAADHAESPGADADPAADLADVFLFISPENPNRLVGSITFGGRPAPRSRTDVVYCDPKVIYVLNIGRATAAGTFTNQPTLKVTARFAGDGLGRCGIKIEGVPGAGGNIMGATETVLTSSTGLRAFAGRRNDPFFFDAEGYNGMIAAFANPPPAGGYLVNAFGLGSRPRRDSFANRNITAIVFEMDVNAVAPAVNGVRPKIQAWATTARRP